MGSNYCLGGKYHTYFTITDFCSASVRIAIDTMKKFSLATLFLSTAFAASSLASMAAAVAKNEIIDEDAATRSVPSRNLVSVVTSKSSKPSSSSCPPKPTQGIECGNVYDSTSGQDVVVTLGQNLICDENITEVEGIRNAALTLIGEGAVLDCQGYTISQVTGSSAAALDCTFPPPDLKGQKKKCGLFYFWGVVLQEGASMVNCNIQKFFGGSEMINGGTIENSQFSLNRKGVDIRNSGSSTVSKVLRR